MFELESLSSKNLIEIHVGLVRKVFYIFTAYFSCLDRQRYSALLEKPLHF